ncbi:permease component of ABC-type sugar transporter [Halobacteroides halobius DSM 5150]|uniref:Permease component of ABC-type sugar transporter n=1 Tax=Halobacteroides halobius (strain ATCC 35273 / DSM 5150 / MD-1) TaxID=748449 RepID=L0K8C3_HALHC|nr:sugar ABC transporter permease [Halobacteroides halobius]AGB41271.1 permease component of ABC-type sugar transporter [Halobacteroides halobius DSM 5150]
MTIQKLKDRFKINKNTVPYYFLAPAIILFTIFTIYPFIKTLLLSFQIREGGHYVWAGLANYKHLFSDQIFLKALKNTLIILICQVPIMTALALLIAIGLNSTLIKLKSIFRISYFTPSVTGLVAYSIVFSILLNDDFGFINYVLSNLGFSKIPWLSSPLWAKIAMMVAITWRWTGYNMVIMLSGLQSIPETLYEAAEIDGAGKIQKLFYITLPQMRPIILFSFVLSTIGTLKLFSEPYILTHGGPNNATLTIALYLYRTGFRYFEFGYASAISYVLIILTAIFSYFQLKIGGEEGGGI